MMPGGQESALARVSVTADTETGDEVVKVSILGFSWTAPDPFSPALFRQDLCAHPDDEHLYRGRSYLLKLWDGDANAAYSRGMIVVARDQRSVVELIREDGGTRKIQIRPLSDDTSLMEFNFFIVNKSMHRGLYATYHHSVSVSTFANMLEHIYGKLKAVRRDQEIANVPDGRGSKTKIKRIKSQYHSARLDASVLYRLEDLAALMQELDAIQSVVLKVATVDVSEPWFTPLQGDARTVVHKVGFQRNIPLNRLVPAIGAAFRDSKAKQGRVIGTDVDGVRRSIDIDEERNHTLYGEADMDDVLAKVGDVSVDEFQTSGVFAWMESIASQSGI